MKRWRPADGQAVERPPKGCALRGLEMRHRDLQDGERAVRTAFPPLTMSPDEPLAKSDGASKARRLGKPRKPPQRARYRNC